MRHSLKYYCIPSLKKGMILSLSSANEVKPQMYFICFARISRVAQLTDKVWVWGYTLPTWLSLLPLRIKQLYLEDIFKDIFFLTISKEDGAYTQNTYFFTYVEC